MIFILVLACRQHGFSAEEALRAATKGAAKAMGLKDRGSPDSPASWPIR